MAQISTNFSLSEFERTSTGLPNSVPLKYMASLSKGVLSILQPLRDTLGVPVVISSGYRSPEVNKRVGGVHNSQHMYGQAADIIVPAHLYNRAWYILAANPNVDQLLGGRNFIHVSWTNGREPRHYFNRTYYK